MADAEAEQRQNLIQQAVERHQAGDLEAALALYRRALDEEAANLDALYLLGTALLQLGRYQESVDVLRQVVDARPDVPDAHNNLGVAYKALGEWEPAARAFQAAIEANPEYDQAFFNLGAVMQERGLPADAEKCFRHGLDLRPNDLPMRYALAGALHDQRKWPDAEACYRELAAADPANHDVEVHLGFVLVRQNRFDEAEAAFRRVLAAKPDFYEIHNNLSYVYERQGRLEQAVAAARMAIDIRPDYAEGHNNLGTALKSLLRLDEARESFRRAIELRPDFPLAEFNLGTTHLLEGDLAAGWPGYDRRGETPIEPDSQSPAPIAYGKPRWDGSPLDGKTILLYAEQGLGDTIQFIRYAPLVKERGGRTIAHCPKPLARLLQGCGGVDRLVVEGDELPEFDVEAPLLSLPRIFGTTLETIPADVPYLFADAKLIQEWKQKLAGIDGFRVGICWQGNRDYPRDYQRSPGLEHFAPLADVPGVALISLQKGEGAEQLSGLPFNAETLGEDFDETSGAFVDTAAVMKNLDLVVTSDTAVPHLAGALRVPVWVALPYLPDWRWLLDRADSPWYPTMRLFRQPRAGDWRSAFNDMASALAEITG